MDKIINTKNGSLTDVEKKLFESLLSGIIPSWLYARMNEARVDAKTGVLGPAKAAVVPTMSDHTVDAPSPSLEVSSSNELSSPPTAPPHPTMPLNRTSLSEPTNNIRCSHVLGKTGEALYTMSQPVVKSTETAFFGKRRAGELESFEQIKRIRHWEENIDPRLQADEEVYDPHFIGPGVSTSVPRPTNTGSTSGHWTAPQPAVTLDATHDNSISKSQQIITVTPPMYHSAASSGSVASPASASIGNSSVRPAQLPTTPALSTSVSENKEPQARSGEKTYKLKPTTRKALEDSNDPARQRTIRAHRANDARQNYTDDIICLWIDPGAEQPCHLSFKGTDALLSHCVMKHGVPSSKDVRDKGACGWDGCPAANMAKGALKRHLEESGLHGRVERIKTSKKNKGNI